MIEIPRRLRRSVEEDDDPTRHGWLTTLAEQIATLEEFDFSFQRSVKKQVVEHLGQLDFLHARENVILPGPCAAVVRFVVAACPSQSRSSAKRTTKALRSLLRFLHAEGHIDRSLAHAVPAASGWRLSSLPKRLEPGQVRRVLASCDHSTRVGRRDFAVLITLARLGLRAGEVASLSLGDVDWRAGEIVVHVKHARADRLPLPVDVGDAIVGYLKAGRPVSAVDRGVFVRVRAPHRAVSRAGVSEIVSDAGLRAGLGRVEAHPLWPTVASEMLRPVGRCRRSGRCCGTAS